MPEASSRFRILALSGGGFRNLFTARVLARLEEELGCALASRFDLIAGTGLGSVLALGLSLEVPAAELVRLFERHGSQLYSRKLSHGRALPRYSSESVQELLAGRRLFGSRTLGDCKYPVIVPVVSRSTGRLVLFKTPHHPDFIYGADSLVDVAMASCATPGLFASHDFNGSQYVDGGLVANAPGMCAMHEAERFFGAQRPALHVLSIGAMSSGRAAELMDAGEQKPSWAHWFQRPVPCPTAFELAISAQESLVENQLRQCIPLDQFHHLDEAVPEGSGHVLPLDRTDLTARNLLIRSADRAAKRFLACPEGRLLLRYPSAPATFFEGPRAFFRSDVYPAGLAIGGGPPSNNVVPIHRA